jgi:hypothetical protein
LLLHGFPQTLLMWRDVEPLLARESTVVCADLRGYGASSCPPSAADHAPYAKRAMAQDMVTVMGGHDRSRARRSRPPSRPADRLPRACAVERRWPAGDLVHSAGGPLELWRELATEVSGGPVDGGHFFAEEHPHRTAIALTEFFA